MKIPFNYLPQEFNKSYSQKIFKEWEKLIKTSEFTLGPFMENFEKKLAIKLMNFQAHILKGRNNLLKNLVNNLANNR